MRKDNRTFTEKLIGDFALISMSQVNKKDKNRALQLAIEKSNIVAGLEKEIYLASKRVNHSVGKNPEGYVQND